MPQPKDYPDDTAPFKQEYRGGIAISGRNNGSGNGSFWLYLLQGLVLAGIVGIVSMLLSMRDNLSSVATTLNIKVIQYDREFERAYKEIDRNRDATGRNSERITNLERESGNRQPYPER